MRVNEFGRSMIEMLGVLAIVAILSVGGIAGYSSAMYKNKINTAREQITTIARNIREAYMTQGNYDTLDNEMAISLGLIPDAMVKDEHTILDPFGGEVLIVATNSDTGYQCDATEHNPCDSFAIMVSGLSRKETIDYAIHPWIDLDIFKVFIDQDEEEVAEAQEPVED